VDDWGGIKWSDMINMFAYADHLNTIPSTAPDLSKTISMQGVFYFASSFNQNISNWDVSNVTNMVGTFQDATAFNQDIHSWYVPLIGAKPTNFDTGSNAGFLNNAAKQPLW
jgi:surface protein